MRTTELETSAGGRLLSHWGFENGSPGVRRRKLFVYLPEAYERSRRRFPVLYLLDGQNVMDLANSKGGGWHVNHTVDQLAREGRIEPPVVVGIANSQQVRLREYLGWSEEPNHRHRSADKHMLYVVHHVLPFIESEYRVVRRRRVIAGASAGGVAALYLALCYPRLFTGVGILSAGRHFFEELRDRFLQERPPAARLFVSCGTRGMDRELLPYTERFCEDLTRLGADFHYHHQPTGSHSERCWAAVMPHLLEYFFGVQK